MAKRATINYIDNDQFSNAVIDYVAAVNVAKRNEHPIPRIPDYIGECILMIAKRLSNASNFARYTYKDEMIGDAVEDCILAVCNFDSDKQTRTGKVNAFGYFTQIAYWAFVNRLNKEKRQQTIKNSIMESNNIESFMTFNPHDATDINLAIANMDYDTMIVNRDNYGRLNEYELKQFDLAVEQVMNEVNELIECAEVAHSRDPISNE